MPATSMWWWIALPLIALVGSAAAALGEPAAAVHSQPLSERPRNIRRS